MRTSGKVNLWLLLTVVGLVVGGWALFTFTGAYMDNIDVKDAVSAGVNQVLQNATDDQIAAFIIDKVSRVGTHKQDDGFGTVTWQPGLGITKDDITIERDDVHNKVTVTVDYFRVVSQKPLKAERRMHFRISKSGPLKQ